MSRPEYEYHDGDTLSFKEFIEWKSWRSKSLQASRATELGRQTLQFLIDSLLALPEQKLLSHGLVDETGMVCAVGAMVKHGIETQPDKIKFKSVREANERIMDGEGDGTPSAVFGLGLHSTLVEETFRQNDERAKIDDHERWNRMLAWARRHKALGEKEIAAKAAS